jgi:hypothetical protein
MGSIKQLHKETGSLSKRLMGKQCVQVLRLERFHNSCIRVARVERRFSAAFSAAKRPAQAAEVDDLSGLERFSLSALYAGLKARTTRTGG